MCESRVSSLRVKLCVRLQRCVAIDEGRKKTKDHGDFEESCCPHNIQPIKIVRVCLIITTSHAFSINFFLLVVFVGALIVCPIVTDVSLRHSWAWRQKCFLKA